MNVDLIASSLPRTAADDDTVAAATQSVTAFTAELYGQLARTAPGNVACSPYSVAVALAMTLQGAGGATAAELRDVLQADDGERLAAGLGELGAVLATRARKHFPLPGEVPPRVELAAANSLWGQADVVWAPAFLDLLARHFGAGMRPVDFRGAAEPARLAINEWVRDLTRERIPELLQPGLVDVETRLVLVNALYLKAPWQAPFTRALTRPQPFTRLDGSAVEAPMMRDEKRGVGYATGPGWAAVDLPYMGRELAMAVIVPDAGRFADVERAMDGPWLDNVLSSFARSFAVDVGLPRWTTRTPALLNDALSELGMPTAFGPRADFGRMTTRGPDLLIDAVVHETFVAVDEDGTEAAAATAVAMRTVAAFLDPPSLVADRPFLYVIHDVPTRTPLFIGRVTDPTTPATPTIPATQG
jgi:serine protease inhibitor